MVFHNVCKCLSQYGYPSNTPYCEICDLESNNISIEEHHVTRSSYLDRTRQAAKRTEKQIDDWVEYHCLTVDDPGVLLASSDEEEEDSHSETEDDSVRAQILPMAIEGTNEMEDYSARAQNLPLSLEGTNEMEDCSAGAQNLPLALEGTNEMEDYSARAQNLPLAQEGRNEMEDNSAQAQILPMALEEINEMEDNSARAQNLPLALEGTNEMGDNSALEGLNELGANGGRARNLPSYPKETDDEDQWVEGSNKIEPARLAEAMEIARMLADSLESDVLMAAAQSGRRISVASPPHDRTLPYSNANISNAPFTTETVGNLTYSSPSSIQKDDSVRTLCSTNIGTLPPSTSQTLPLGRISGRGEEWTHTTDGSDAVRRYDALDGYISTIPPRSTPPGSSNARLPPHNEFFSKESQSPNPSHFSAEWLSRSSQPRPQDQENVNPSVRKKATKNNASVKGRGTQRRAPRGRGGKQLSASRLSPLNYHNSNGDEQGRSPSSISQATSIVGNGRAAEIPVSQLQLRTPSPATRPNPYGSSRAKNENQEVVMSPQARQLHTLGDSMIMANCRPSSASGSIPVETLSRVTPPSQPRPIAEESVNPSVGNEGMPPTNYQTNWNGHRQRGIEPAAELSMCKPQLGMQSPAIHPNPHGSLRLPNNENQELAMTPQTRQIHTSGGSMIVANQITYGNISVETCSRFTPPSQSRPVDQESVIHSVGNTGMLPLNYHNNWNWHRQRGSPSSTSQVAVNSSMMRIEPAAEISMCKPELVTQSPAIHPNPHGSLQLPYNGNQELVMTPLARQIHTSGGSMIVANQITYGNILVETCSRFMPPSQSRPLYQESVNPSVQKKATKNKAPVRGRTTRRRTPRGKGGKQLRASRMPPLISHNSNGHGLRGLPSLISRMAVNSSLTRMEQAAEIPTNEPELRTPSPATQTNPRRFLQAPNNGNQELAISPLARRLSASGVSMTKAIPRPSSPSRSIPVETFDQVTPDTATAPTITPRQQTRQMITIRSGEVWTSSPSIQIPLHQPQLPPPEIQKTCQITTNTTDFTRQIHASGVSKTMGNPTLYPPYGWIPFGAISQVPQHPTVTPQQQSFPMTTNRSGEVTLSPSFEMPHHPAQPPPPKKQKTGPMTTNGSEEVTSSPLLQMPLHSPQANYVDSIDGSSGTVTPSTQKIYPPENSVQISKPPIQAQDNAYTNLAPPNRAATYPAATARDGAFIPWTPSSTRTLPVDHGSDSHQGLRLPPFESIKPSTFKYSHDHGHLADDIGKKKMLDDFCRQYHADSPSPNPSLPSIDSPPFQETTSFMPIDPTATQDRAPFKPKSPVDPVSPVPQNTNLEQRIDNGMQAIVPIRTHLLQNRVFTSRHRRKATVPRKRRPKTLMLPNVPSPPIPPPPRKGIEHFIIVCEGEAFKVDSRILEEASPVVRDFSEKCLEAGATGDCFFEVVGVSPDAMYELLKYICCTSYNQFFMRTTYMRKVAEKLKIKINFDEAP